jgi:hypothetical protein
MEDEFPAEIYLRAERFCKWNVQKLFKNVSIEPRGGRAQHRKSSPATRPR